MSIAAHVEPSLFPWADGEPEPDVCLSEFFTPAFMREFTRFASFEAFTRESPWAMEDRGDLDRVPPDELDQYVRRVTEFESWVGMQNRAAEREVRERLLV